MGIGVKAAEHLCEVRSPAAAKCVCVCGACVGWASRMCLSTYCIAQVLTRESRRAAHEAAAAARKPGMPAREAVVVRRIRDARCPHVILRHVESNTELRLNATHYAKLVRLYQLARLGTSAAGAAATGTPAAHTSAGDAFMHTCMFCVVQRYETLSGQSSGYQGALPDSTFKAMHDLFGVTHECFASPLNCYFPSFCRCGVVLPVPLPEPPVLSRGMCCVCDLLTLPQHVHRHRSPLRQRWIILRVSPNHRLVRV